MPARREELHHAKEEGVELFCLHAPLACEGHYCELPTDMAIVAVGTRANPLLPRVTPGLGTVWWSGSLTGWHALRGSCWKRWKPWSNAALASGFSPKTLTRPMPAAGLSSPSLAPLPSLRGKSSVNAPEPGSTLLAHVTGGGAPTFFV